MSRRVVLLPLGGLESQGTLDYLATGLSRVLNVECAVGQTELDTTFAFNAHRGQYSAPGLLLAMRARAGLQDAIGLGVLAGDLYADGLTFVFGQAEMPGQWAIISLHRLHAGGDGAVDRVLEVRALKEAVHEIGHTLGLPHCPDASCVMHFSNSIADTDAKQDSPCPACMSRLPQGREAK